MAAKPDLESLSIADLQALIADAQKVLGAKVQAERAELQRKLQELDAIAAPAATDSRKRALPEPKYRSLRDPSQTWAGRGGTPRWLSAEMEETGKKLDDFKIKS
jgi:DNA-binding protein H-NS